MIFDRLNQLSINDKARSASFLLAVDASRRPSQTEAEVAGAAAAGGMKPAPGRWRLPALSVLLLLLVFLSFRSLEATGDRGSGVHGRGTGGSHGGERGGDSPGGSVAGQWDRRPGPRGTARCPLRDPNAPREPSERFPGPPRSGGRCSPVGPGFRVPLSRSPGTTGPSVRFGNRLTPRGECVPETPSDFVPEVGFWN